MAFLRRNIALGPALKLSPWRKIAIGTWMQPGDPSVYGTLELDVTAALAYLEAERQKTQEKLTLTHFVGRAVAEVLHRHPDINCILRWGRLYPRKSVDVFFQVANDDAGKDLSGLTIRDAQHKSLGTIAAEMREKVEAIRTKGDPAFKKMKGMMALVPGAFVHRLLNLSGFILYSLNLWTPLLGVPRDSFGSVMVTNIGSLGLDIAHAPLVPYSRVPLLIAVGSIKQVPVVRDGKIVVATVCALGITLDHRLIDGKQGSHMQRTLKRIFEHPERELQVRG